VFFFLILKWYRVREEVSQEYKTRATQFFPMLFPHVTETNQVWTRLNDSTLLIHAMFSKYGL